MTRIALLDDTLPAQVDENPDDLEGLEVVWAGTDADELERRLPDLQPHVVVCSLPLLGTDPGPRLRALESSNAELVLLLYQFARRTDVSRLEGKGRRVLQAPITTARLRSQMMSVVIGHMLGDDRRDATRPVSPRAEQAPRARPGRPIHPEPARYSATQLGRLMEIESAVDCECPNHLAQIVSSLRAFEIYSAECESKDDEDAEVHRMLHVETAKARQVMEDALSRLVAHEKIVL